MNESGLNEIPAEVPVLPVRDTVLFPHAVLPLNVGRESSLALLNSLGEEKIIAVATQRDPRNDTPAPEDLYPVVSLATVHKIIRMPNQTLFVFCEGLTRLQAIEYSQREPFLKAHCRPLAEIPMEPSAQRDALMRSVVQMFQQIVAASPALSDDLQTIAAGIEDPGRLADFIASTLPSLTSAERQELLEMADQQARLHAIHRFLTKEDEVQQLRQKIQSQVQDQLSASQREFYLREQLKAIQKELGEGDENQREIEELRRKIEDAHMPEEVRKETDKELGRLARMNPAQPDYGVTRNYLDWLVALPWAHSSGQAVDILKASEILDIDHYDLEKVKNRILDYLAVLQLKPQMKGPILCFVGPPGVGKTSLGRSIARALARKFVRLSLGGIHDEAEIRGHRRTYIGALPGQIIQSIRRAGTNDPVFMLDEVDKIGRDFRGDPASALLEALDPEQNFAFRDHYLDVPFDLSKVLFITTANVLDPVPEPLRDRMEVIELPGYIEDEKVQIAFQYLIPKQGRENGLLPVEDEKTAARMALREAATAQKEGGAAEAANVPSASAEGQAAANPVVEAPPAAVSQPGHGDASKAIPDIRFTEEAVHQIVRYYTREAGVRNLEREIGTICRKVARRKAEGKLTEVPFIISRDAVRDFLGGPKMHIDTEVAERTAQPGVAVGLAWTPAGGDILFVEANKMRGGSKGLIMTGHLGPVMQESMQAAMSWVRAHAEQFNLEDDFFSKHDLHIHVPAGAIPKDGPSAGVTMVTALASLLGGRRVRPNIAMTGEITLSGLVLPVGGIKEKVLAAKRAGITDVLLPKENQVNVEEDLKPEQLKGLSLHYVNTIDEVIKLALVQPGETKQVQPHPEPAAVPEPLAALS
jgi:ATP-dependent Lon protease